MLVFLKCDLNGGAIKTDINPLKSGQRGTPEGEAVM